MNAVVTRFAPSPTGLLHAGNYRTAVFAYLFAKHSNGSFIVRIEDTDATRSKPEYEANIFDTLAWLGLSIDQKYRQSEHKTRHRELLEKLISDNTAYISKETVKNIGDREEVIRFRNQGGAVSFTDAIRGGITMEVGDLGDFVIARSFDEPVFHFAVVVDDADEKVTHVIRGEDHISNTPRQILIQRALGFATPVYAHLPLILGSDRTKLSKRSGAKALIDYRDSGYLPEAMLNYLAFLGWNPGDEREYLSREELIEAFDISRVQKGSAFFDETKLLSVNQHWMRELSDDDFLARGNFTSSNLDKIRKAIPLMKERARTFEEAQNMIEYELAFIFTPPEISADSLPSPDRPQVRREWLLSKAPSWHVGTVKNGLKETCNALEALGGDVSPRIVKDTLMPIADAAGMGDGRGAVLWALRFALSGQERSPDPFTLISILGKEEAISRIRKAIAIL